VKYEKLPVVLINAIKEQQEQIGQLQKSVTALQRQNAQLLKRWHALSRPLRNTQRNSRGIRNTKRPA